jgi:hypothetical protein
MNNEILRWSAVEAQLERYREFYREAEEERLILQKRYGASLQASDLQIENLVCSK